MAVSEERTRRSVLTIGLGALAAGVAGLFGRPAPVQATHGDVHLGTLNTATNTTVVQNTDSGESALWGDATHTSSVNVGVRGDSASPAGYGVWGRYSGSPNSTATGYGTGVLGETYLPNGRAIHGRLPNETPGVGVYGEASHAGGIGVQGGTSHGTGVYGFASDGVALYGGGGRTGSALKTLGNLRFQRVSGVATIAAGKTSVVVSPEFVDVGLSSFVLLTPKANLAGRSIWFTTDTAGDKFTIRMSSSRSSPTPIAWLLANSS